MSLVCLFHEAVDMIEVAFLLFDSSIAEQEKRDINLVHRLMEQAAVRLPLT